MQNCCVLPITSSLEFTQSEHAQLHKDAKVSGKYAEQHVENKNFSYSTAFPHFKGSGKLFHDLSCEGDEVNISRLFMQF